MSKEGTQPPPYQQNAEQGRPAVPAPYPNQPYPTQHYPVQSYPVQTSVYPPQQGPPPQQGVPPQAAVAGYPPQPPPQTFVYEHKDGTFESLKRAVPSLPMCMAVFCLIINCMLPGIGTVIASFASLCCADVRGVDTGKLGLFCINFWIGWAQLILIVFGIGWIWSIFWGMLFLHQAKSQRQKEEEGVSVVIKSAPMQNNSTLPGAQDNRGFQ